MTRLASGVEWRWHGKTLAEQALSEAIVRHVTRTNRHPNAVEIPPDTELLVPDGMRILVVDQRPRNSLMVGCLE